MEPETSYTPSPRLSEYIVLVVRILGNTRYAGWGGERRRVVGRDLDDVGRRKRRYNQRFHMVHVKVRRCKTTSFLRWHKHIDKGGSGKGNLAQITRGTLQFPCICVTLILYVRFRARVFSLGDRHCCYRCRCVIGG